MNKYSFIFKSGNLCQCFRVRSTGTDNGKKKITNHWRLIEMRKNTSVGGKMVTLK